MKYEKLATQIIAAVGGKENITSLSHCMTRLRFTLADESKADDEKIQSIEGVLSLVKKAGQYQIVIGQHVHDVYVDVCASAGIKEEGQLEINEDNQPKKSFFQSLFGVIIGCLGPVIPILVGCGLGRCILTLISSLTGINGETSFTYYMFNLVFDAGYTYLPVFTAVAAAKYFKCNQFIAAVIGCALVHPNWMSIANPYVPTIVGKIFGFLPVYGMTYTSSFLPSILVVFVMSLVERLCNKYIPQIVRSMLTPLVTLVVMVPLTFVVCAPIMGYLAKLLAVVLLFIYQKFGVFAIAIMCIIYPWIVACGMHAPLAVAGIQLLQTMGFDPISRTLTLCANMAQGSAALACAIKTKNKDFRTTAISACTTAFLAGITEPCIYGVSFRLKKPMIAVTIGCGVAGLYAGIVGLKAFAFMTPSFLNFPMWMASDGTMSNLINAFITMAIACVVTFVVTWILGFEDPKEEEVSTVETKK